MNVPLPKRLLSLLLCCAMLLGLLPGVSFTAYAESDTAVNAAELPVIEAEGSVEVSLAPGESTTILFTPTYDANYIVVDYRYNWITLAVYDVKGDCLSDGGNHSATFDGVSGKTYLIQATNYGEEQRDGLIYVFPSDNAISITLRTGGMDGPSSYSGSVGDQVYVDAHFEQLNAIRRNLVWGVSNTSVVQIVDRYDDTCVLELVGEGSATLTATNPNGLSATFTVTSKVVESLAAGDVKSMSMNPQSRECFTFTPAETGTYTLWCEEQLNEWPHLEVFDEDGQTVSLSWLRNSFAAEQGKAYKILVFNYSDNHWNFTLHLDAAVPADELWLDHHESEMVVGETGGVGFSMAPANADRSNVTWSVDDPNVIELYNDNQNDCQFRAVGAGTATITVTDGNRSDSLTITVREPVFLTENEPMTLNPSFGEEVRFTFVPQEDGVYTIGETNGFTPWMHLWGPDVDMWNHGFVQAYLRAGEFYQISARYWIDPMPELTFCAVKAGPAEGIRFQQEEYTGYEGEVIDARLSYFPFGAEMEDMEYTMEGTGGAELVDPWRVGTRLNLTQPGTFTLTATSQSNPEHTASCTVTVLEPEKIALGESRALTLQGYEPQMLLFTAPQDGGYILWQEDNDRTAWITMEADPDTFVPGDGYLQFEAAAGQRILICIYANSDEPYDAVFHMDNLVPVESLSLRTPEEWINGVDGQRMGVQLSYFPANASRGRVQWESSNPAVAEIVGEGWTGCEIRFHEAGTATITARGKNNTSVSFTATSYGSSGELVLDETVYFSTEHSQVLSYHFTIPEDGTYIIWDDNQNWHGVELLDSNGYQINWLDNTVQFYASAGQEYTVLFHCYNDVPTEYAYTLSKTGTAERIALHKTSASGYPGEEVWLVVLYNPGNALREDVTWTTSDSNVVQIMEGDPDICGVRLVNSGTATVTVETKDGLTASCEITVLDTISLEEDRPVDVHMDAWERKVFNFTPSESGIYAFWETKGIDCWTELWGPEGLCHNTSVQGYLEAGQTYFFSADVWDRPQEMTFCVSKTVPAESIRFFEEYDCVEGEIIHAKLRYEPLNAQWEEIEYTFDGGEILAHESQWGKLHLTKPGTFTLTATSKNNPALTASCTITVRESEAVRLGDTLELTLQGWEPVAYRFTAPEDGSYILWQESAARTIMDLSGNFRSCASGNGFAQFEMEAGQTCIIRLHPNSEEPYQAVFHMGTPAAAEAFYLDENAALTGAAGQRVWYNLCYTPGNALREPLQWESSDPAVAEIVQASMENCCVMFHQAGSATITATAPNGISTSFTVTSYGSNGELVLDETEYFTMDGPGSVSYSFTVPEDGTYILWDANHNWGWMDILDSNGERVVEDDNAAQFQASAGQTYTVIFHCHREEPMEFAYTLSKPVKAEGVSLHESQLILFSGEEAWLNVIYTPGNALRKEVTWSSSDPSVIEPFYSSTDNCGFHVGQPGTATVTLTTADGLTASCEVTVRDYREIHAGETLNITIPTEDAAGFVFAPTESGTYYLWSEEEMMPFLELFDSYRNYLGSASAIQPRLKISAAAGEVYYIQAFNHTPYQGFTLHLDKATTAAGLSLSPRGYIYAGLGSTLSVTTIPGNGYHGPLEWESSNPEIMEVESYDPDFDHCLFNAKAPGEVTITVRDTELGLEASRTITVLPILSLELGTTVTVDQPAPMAYSLKSFTPETDGTYVLKAEADGFVSTWIYQAETFEDAQQHLFSEEEPEWKLELKGGVTYWIESSLLDAQQNPTTGSYTLRMALPALSGTCGENLTWTLEDGVLTISGTGDMENYSDPWVEKPAPWYAEQASITSVVVQEGVTSIGDWAFGGCYNLTSLTIPEGVTSLGQFVIGGCYNLTTLTLPSSLTSIGERVFNGTFSLSTVTIPDTNAHFRTIDGALFNKDRTALLFVPRTLSGSYIVPETVASIGADAFFNCVELTGITLPKGLTSIGGFAFWGCSSLSRLTIPEGVTSIGDSTFANCSSLTSINIPEGVTSIGVSTFGGCSSLTSLTIPEGVTSIGFGAFSGCEGLTSLTIPEGVTSIGDRAFNRCTNLETVYYGGTQEQWDKITIGDSNECLTNAQIIVKKAGTCGENLTWTLEDGVLTISGTGEMVGFVPQYVECSAPWKDHASEIVKVVIGEGVTNVATHTFTYCTNLTSVTLPSTITSIDANAFWGCSSLTEIQIPVSVKSIIFGAFHDTGLEIVHYDGTREQWDEINIGNMNECLTNATIVYGDPSALMKLSLPKGTTIVEEAAFQDCVTLESVLIPAGVKSIEALAFDGCSGLKTITFTGSAPAISGNAFTGVTATVYYPVNDSSWSNAIQQSYGGTLTWVPYAAK